MKRGLGCMKWLNGKFFYVYFIINKIIINKREFGRESFRE